MDPKLVKIAKNIPERLKEVMNSMFEASEPALKSGVATLRQSLAKLDSYLQQVEKEQGGASVAAAGAKATATATSVPAKQTRRRRRKGKNTISNLVLAELAKKPKGLRPFELAAIIADATGMEKKRATGNVTTVLYRLKKSGALAVRNGVYASPGKALTDGNTSGGKKAKKEGRKK